MKKEDFKKFLDKIDPRLWGNYEENFDREFSYNNESYEEFFIKKEANEFLVTAFDWFNQKVPSNINWVTVNAYWYKHLKENNI